MITFIQTNFVTSPIKTARYLRQVMTPEEKLLWQELRAHRFSGFKFRRQHPIVYEASLNRTFFYVADFYCAVRKLVVELDGKPHEFEEQKEYDRARDCIMREMGLKILRIKNEELLSMKKALQKIEEVLNH